MATRIAYQFDRAGQLVGATEADESPLEPGIFLLPARSTFAPPPEDFEADKWPRWDGTAWQLVSKPQAEAESENPLAKLQAFLHANPEIAALLDAGG